MNTKKGEKEMKTLQEKYDELRVKYEDALYRYRNKESVTATARMECENLFTQLKQIRDEMTGR